MRAGRQSNLLAELPPADAAELVALLRPTFDRIRTGEYRLMLTGARDGAGRSEIGMFQSRFMELIDLIEARPTMR